MGIEMGHQTLCNPWSFHHPGWQAFHKNQRAALSDTLQFPPHLPISVIQCAAASAGTTPSKRSQTPLPSERAPGWQEESPTTSTTSPSTPQATESPRSQSSEEVSHREGEGGGEGAPRESLWDRLLARESLPPDKEGSKLRLEVIEVYLLAYLLPAV